VLQHARDALAPLGVGEYVHSHLAGSQLKVLDSTGHCAHLSNPELVIDAMRDYLGVPAP
jgi:sigma-B regulation protein RsbQ